MGRDFVYAHVDTVAGGEMTLAAGKFGGFILSGSAATATLSIYDGAVLLLTTSAAINSVVYQNFDAPIACTTSILATCSGTGYYSVFIAP